MGIPVDILIFRRECGKIKMSGKFSDISTDIYIFSNSFSQMSMGILQTFLFSGRKVGK
jgi:hypothetical protein